MKPISYILAILLTGCIYEPSQIAAPEAEKMKDDIYIGTFVYGHEVSSYQPCNSEAAFWLDGDQEQMKIIEDASLNLMKQRQKPYQPVYVEFQGVPSTAEPIGFQDSYDGVLILNSLITYSTTIPENCKIIYPKEN